MTESADGPIHVTYRPGDPPSGELFLRADAELVVTLHGSPGYGWTAITGAQGPLVVVSQTERGGSVQAVLRARGEGEVELRSTCSFSGDRFGPQTRLWRLRVTVRR